MPLPVEELVTVLLFGGHYDEKISSLLRYTRLADVKGLKHDKAHARKL
jgi:hypothetical protein